MRLWSSRSVASLFFFSSRRRHTRCSRDWSSDVCSSDLSGSEEKTFNAEDTEKRESTKKSGEKSARAKPAVAVETVFMPSEGRQTICISTQAGCAVDCHFCLTAQLGLLRNLTAGEIVAQVLVALEAQGDKENASRLKPGQTRNAVQTNVVLMGQGEPLLNFEPVMAALRILLEPR